MTIPRVSVLMPVKNGGDYVGDAINTIRGQTFTDWELLVVENGSTDATRDIVARIASSDSRIRLLTLGDAGLVAALNRGLAEATGEYIARMDADDLADPTRLEVQVRYLDEHPECLLVGTGYRYIDELDHVTAQRRVVASNDAIRAEMYFGNPIGHSTVMMARSRIRGALQYSDEFPDAEDFELWLRLSALGELANIATPLLSHRVHSTAVTQVAGNASRLSSLRALSHSTQWPDGEAMYSATFNPDLGDGYWFLFKGVWSLNIANLRHPTVSRRRLLQRSLVALARPVRAHFLNR